VTSNQHDFKIPVRLSLRCTGILFLRANNLVECLLGVNEHRVPQEGNQPFPSLLEFPDFEVLDASVRHFFVRGLHRSFEHRGSLSGFRFGLEVLQQPHLPRLENLGT